MGIKPEPKYDLHYSYPCGGWISFEGEDTGAFLQGDDYYDLEKQIDDLWKRVAWKKIGHRRACEIQDSILSEYVPD